MIGNRIKAKRTELGLTQAQLAAVTGIKSTTISNYENNISSPGDDNIHKLMRALNCDANYLFEWEEVKDIRLSSEEKKHITRYRTLDGYGKRAVDNILDIEYDRCNGGKQAMIEIELFELPASAGTGEFLSDEMTKIIEIPDTPFNRSADFIVQVSGDSMLPEYEDDDFLLVRKQETVNEGEVGIFVLNGCGYVKKFGGNKLISINSKYNDIEYGEYDNIVCYGKVIGKM